MTTLTDALDRILSEADFDLLEQDEEEEQKRLQLPRFDKATSKFFWPDGRHAGTFTSWPKETFKNQRVTCRQHASCNKTLQTSKVPGKDAWERWLLRGLKPGVDTAAKHRAEWDKMVAEEYSAAP